MDKKLQSKNLKRNDRGWEGNIKTILQK